MEMQSVEPTDVGARIRAARQRVGLTQAELAGSIVSPSYLSRLEAGERSPARETLERLATALDLTVDQLLSGDLPADHTEADAASRVDQAELLLAGGELDQAMRIVEDLLGTPGVRRWPSIRARAGLVRGLVWEARNDLSAAIVELEDVVASSASLGAPSIPATIALSRCYRESGEYELAISTGGAVLDQLAAVGLSGGTEAIRLAVTVAGAQLQSGQVEVAIRTCLRAIEEAERIGSLEGAAAAYWNASAALRESGATAQAHEFATRAMAILENGDSTRNLGRLRVSLALLQITMQDADADQVEALLDRAAKELRGSPASAIDLAHYHHAMTRLHLRRRDYHRAIAELDCVAVEQVADRSAEMACETALLRAVVLLRSGEFPEAEVREAVSVADVSLRLLGQDRISGQMWFELAAAARDCGDEDLAFTALWEAAVTLGAAVPVFQSLDSPACSLPSAAEGSRRSF